MGENETAGSYKVALEKAEQLLGCLRPAVLVVNASLPIDWAPVRELFLRLGYSVMELGKMDGTLGRRVKADYVVILAQESDYEALQERLASLCDVRYSYIYAYPNNQRQYRSWRKEETAATVREELALNDRCWREHCAALDGACFTLLL